MLSQPFHRVVAVPGVVHVFGKPAFRLEPAPAILHHGNVAIGGEEGRFLCPGFGSLVIWGTLQQNRQRSLDDLATAGRTVHVGRQHHPVPHRNRDVMLHLYLVTHGIFASPTGLDEYLTMQ